MMTGLLSRTRLRAASGALVLLAGFGLLAGCGDDGEKTVVSGEGGKVTVDDGEVTVETDEGTATIGEDLPDGFPTEDIPLIDGKVISGVKGGVSGQFAWSVVMETDRAVDDVAAEVKKDFADEGYTAGEAAEMGDVSILQFSSDPYDVGVTAARTGDKVTVTYVVKDKG